MKFYDETWMKASVAEDMKRRALVGMHDPTPHPGGNSRYYDRQNMRYLEYCKGLHLPTGSLLIFTRDTGHHRCGWLKNPDYERCLHLSLSFIDPETNERLKHKDTRLTKLWLELFFGEWQRYLWVESAKSKEGIELRVWHYRVFCDEAWQPIIPRGEVYSTELTEAGWKSFSEVNADHEQWEQAP